MLMRLYSAVLALLVSSVGANASACGDYAYVHWYAVSDLEAAAVFLDTAAHYSRGPRIDQVSPWDANGPKYASIDFCPASADGRLIRLTQVHEEALAQTGIKAGVLTVGSTDFTASRAAATALAKGTVNSGTRNGLSIMWFEDDYGNSFIVEEMRQ